MDLESNDPATTYLVEWELLVDELSYINNRISYIKHYIKFRSKED